jgi:hypothetical protein
MRYAASILVCLFACGGTTTNGNTDSGTPTPTPDSDAGTNMETPDTGSTPEIPYPAPRPNYPRVTNSGGGVLNNFTVVPIVYANDALQSQIEQFFQELAPSSYWTAVTKEYGAGAFTIEKTIVVTDPAPSLIDDADIGKWLVARADGTVMGFPPANGQTLYALFYPSTTTITLQGSKSCSSFGAYHSDTALADSTKIPYAVMPRCPEAATDPYPMSQPAYQFVDYDHVIWGLRGGGEVGDLCALYYNTSYGRLVGNFVVQRSWSNAAMKAGHDPCVPATADPYFNAVPDLGETVTMNFGGQSIKTKGAKIPLNTSKTIDVMLYSDAPKEAWTVSASDRSSSQGGQPYLTFAWDKTTGKNGDILHLTITPVRQPQGGSASFTITSTDSKMVRHAWYGVISLN